MAGIGKMEPLASWPNAQPLIRVRGLSKRGCQICTGEVLNVLKMENLNFDINEGEITSIIGNSGGGKTTLLKIMQGVEMPDEGVVYYRYGDKWVDMMTYSPDRMNVRRTLGIMYQEFALYAGETILDQIAYQMGIKGNDVIEHARAMAEELGISDKVLDVIYAMTDMSEEDAKAALESLGLTRDIFKDLFPRFPTTEARKFAEPIFDLISLDQEVMWKLPEQLSGGELVRASLAILLAARPKILILDEPFGDIDPITMREVSNAIKKINAEFGTTIILVSHHVDFVKEISHRAMLIENGAIAADGDPAEVCNAFLASCHAPYLKYLEERYASSRMIGNGRASRGDLPAGGRSDHAGGFPGESGGEGGPHGGAMRWQDCGHACGPGPGCIRGADQDWQHPAGDGKCHLHGQSARRLRDPRVSPL